MTESRSGDSRASICFAFDKFRLEPARRLLTDAEGTPIGIRGKAFDALVYLVEHSGAVVERSDLVHALWPKTVVEGNNVNQAIAVLRRALGDGHIATVAGRGYQFVTPVRRLAAPDVSAPVREQSPVPPNRVRWRAPAAAMIIGAVLLAVIALALLRAPTDSMPTGIGELSGVSTITTYPGAELTPALSPDGSRVVFSWNGDSGKRDIYAAQISTGVPLRLTSSNRGDDLYPVWSPDSERIAFLRRHDEVRHDIVVVPALGGPERTLYESRLYWISVEGYPLLAWSPDGQHLLFTSLVEGSEKAPTYALHVLTADTGAVRPFGMARDELDYDTSPALSPDGRWLAFCRYHRGERLAVLMVQQLGPGLDPIGMPAAVPGVDPGVPHSLAWSADGKRLYFINGGQIVEWPVGGRARTAYTLVPPLTRGLASIVDRGALTRALFSVPEVDADIFALPLDPVTHASRGPPVARARSSSFERHPRLSPDGRRLAFVSGRSGKVAVWLANADGSGSRQLSSLDALISGFPRWSPDGQRIVFHVSAADEERVIYAVDIDSGDAVRVSNGCCPGGWSADGRYVYASAISGVNHVLRIRVADGQREQLFEGELATETIDGGSLLYAKSRERGVFMRRLASPLIEDTETRLVDDYVPPLGGIVPVADGFFYVGHSTEGKPRAFRFFEFATNSARDVAPAPASIGLGLTVSPDGLELLYSADRDDPNADLMLLQFASTRSN